MHPSQLLIDTVSKGLTDFDQQGAGIISTKEHHPIPCHAKLLSPRCYFISINPKQSIYNININKQYQQTPGLIQRLINIIHLLLIGVIVAQMFCLR